MAGIGEDVDYDERYGFRRYDIAQLTSSLREQKKKQSYLTYVLQNTHNFSQKDILNDELDNLDLEIDRLSIALQTALEEEEKMKKQRALATRRARVAKMRGQGRRHKGNPRAKLAMRMAKELRGRGYGKREALQLAWQHV